MKNILVGPLPPPFYGQSISFKLLIDSIDKNNIKIVDISGFNISNKNNFIRALEYIFILLNYFFKTAFGNKKVYITIAQSKLGFIRDFIMIWFATLFNHKIFIHLKGGNYGNFYNEQNKLMKFLIRKTLIKTDKILVLSDRLKSMFDFEERLKGKIKVVYNGLPMEEVECDKNIGNRTEINILYLSNLIESKGYFETLKALNILINDYGINNVKGHFCGQFKKNKDDKTKRSINESKSEFFNYIEENDLSNNVFYHGVVSGDKKNEMLEKAHFFVLPTYYDNEGQPVSIIEAIAFSTVVISTNYRSIPDLVKDNETGYLINDQKPSKIADKIKNLIDNPNKYKRFSENSYKHFKNNFSTETHIENMKNLLEIN